ncbi:MAG: tRNA uridine-5-carboxymethylaminomethyl(34) synthesis GTPase MnmE [Allorhizobium sp.]
MVRSHQDTIFALSSGGLPAGVAVVRISGDEAFDICRKMCGELPPPRLASLRSIRSRNGAVLDRGIVLAFPGPHSFTGEDCIEFHLHGGKAVVAAVLGELQLFDGCRLAEAGEFSRRAFESGKVDLVEIEGLADLLAAETEMQRRLAAEQSFGKLSAIYSSWRERLLHARAMIEAELDFADEGDIPGSVSDRIWVEMEALGKEIGRHIAQERVGEIIRDGFKVVIVGPPNAGKSSLMNSLANREVAIVTEYAGTTRDILHCELDLGGFAVHLFDTAGIRDTDEAIEREGIRRAMLKIEEADLILYLSDASSPVGFDPEAFDSVSAPVIRVCTKSDLLGDSKPKQSLELCISTVTGDGLDDLRAIILTHLEAMAGGLSLAIPSRLRQREHISDVLVNIEAAVGNTDIGLEVRAEHLRRASDAIGRISGKIDVESLLGKIFSDFCIGK